ncbi:MAG: hypothetical protein M3N24_04200 [Actinomycetota bacterium]|nr:hypothetical protein [Actinomycetota bacterium]
MGSDVDQARKAVRRGDSDEALVLLWNAVEPARLAGDGAALERIGGLAQVIASSGDESQKREARRLLEMLHVAATEEGGAPATARLDADVSSVGEKLEDDVVHESGAQARPRVPVGTIVWFLIVFVFVAMQVARRFTE